MAGSPTDTIATSSPSTRNLTQPEGFEYPALSTRREIRLLIVSCDETSLRLTGSLEVVSLDSLNRSYKAISYHWDRILPEEEVVLKSVGPLAINGTAASALRWFARTNPGEPVWLDQICINQTDLEEKSQQIRLMTDIFSCAQQVVAFLGDPTDDSELALAHMTSLYGAIRRSSDGKEALSLDELGVLGVLEESTNTDWDALAKLIARPYFTRMWIVQELVVATDSVLVCGDLSMPMDQLMQVSRVLQRSNLIAMVNILHEGERKAIGGVGHLAVMLDLQTRRHRLEPISFQQGLVACRLFQATDPRDKLFALLGLMSDTDDSLFNPDYVYDPEEVYLRFARHDIDQYGSAEHLHFAGIGHQRRLQALPSWVPDWSAGPAASASFLDYSPAIHYSAAGSQLPTITNASPDRLTVKCRLLDITSRLLPLEPMNIFNQLEENIEGAKLQPCIGWYEIVAEVFQQLERYRISGNWIEAMARTLVADFDIGNGKSATAEFVKHLSGFVSMLRTLAEIWYVENGVDFIVERETAPLLDKSLFLPYMPELPAGKDCHEENVTDQAIDLSMSWVSSRARLRMHRIFLTADGYAGIGPPLMEEKDVLCLIYGAITPFLLRPAHDRETYSLVGECYVHGLMNGEAIEMGEEMDITLL